MKIQFNKSMLDSLNKKVEKRSTNSKNSNFDEKDKLDFYNLSGYGKYIFRMLPPDSSITNGCFWKYVGTHFGLPKDSSSDGLVAPCVEMYGEEDAVCPVCELFREMANSGIDTQGFWKMKARQEVAIKVLMLSTPKTEAEGVELEKKVSILRMPLKVFKTLISYYQEPTTPDLMDPNLGCAVVIKRAEGEKLWQVNSLDSSITKYCGLLGGSVEVMQALLKKNETLSLNTIFKLPTDDRMQQLKNSANILRNRVMQAKGTMENTANTLAESGAVSKEPAPISMQREIPIVNPMNNQPVVQPKTVEAVPVAKVEEAEDDGIPFPVDTPSPIATVAPVQATIVAPQPVVQPTPVEAPAPVAQPVVDENNLTPEQLKIINDLRTQHGIRQECFGKLSKFNITKPDCMLCQNWNECALAIYKVFGVKVQTDFD